MTERYRLLVNMLTFVFLLVGLPNCSYAKEGGHQPFSPEKLEYLIKKFESADRSAWQMPEAVIEHLRIKSGDTVADIGSGTGYFTHLFSRAAGNSGKVYAIDVDPGFIKHLQERFSEDRWKNVAVKKVPYDDPRLPGKSCDLIFFSDSWHHISGRPHYLTRVYRALKDSGRLVIVDYRYWQLPDTPPLDHRIPRDQVIKEVTENGFRLHGEFFFLPRQYFLVFKKVMLPQ
ncbi:MAG: methyltransferase domain-containing protein [bacterium]